MKWNCSIPVLSRFVVHCQNLITFSLFFFALRSNTTCNNTISIDSKYVFFLFFFFFLFYFDEMRSFYVFSLNGLYECEQHWICPLPKDFPNGNRRICLFSINFSYFRENCTPFQSWTRIKLILMQFHNNFPFCLFTLSRENLFPNCFSFFFALVSLHVSVSIFLSCLSSMCRAFDRKERL